MVETYKLLANREYAAALAAAKRWMANDKDDTFFGGGIFSIGEALTGLQRFKEAEAHFRDIWKRPKPMNSKVAEHAVRLALALVCQEKFSEARDVLLEAMKGHDSLWNGYYVPWALLYVHSRSPENCPREVVEAAFAMPDKRLQKLHDLKIPGFSRTWGEIISDGVRGRKTREETVREFEAAVPEWTKPRVRARILCDELSRLAFYEGLAHLRAGREDDYLRSMYEYVTMLGLTQHYYEWYAAEHELIRRPGPWKRKYQRWLREQKAAREAKAEQKRAARESTGSSMTGRTGVSAKSIGKKAAKVVAKAATRKKSRPVAE